MVVDQLTNGPMDTARIITDYENTAVYTPLTYLPQAIAISLARLFQASVLLQLYAARLATLITWIILMRLGLKNLPSGKWAVVAIALSPIVTALSCSTSGDSTTFALIFLWISLCLKLRNSMGVLSKMDKVYLTILSLALGLLKAPYMIVAGMVLVIPKMRFTKKMTVLSWKTLWTATPVLVAITWLLLNKSIYITTNPDANTILQIFYILRDPVGVFLDFAYTLFLSPLVTTY